MDMDMEKWQMNHKLPGRPERVCGGRGGQVSGEGPVGSVCAQSLSCVQLCDPADGGPPGSSVHGTIQARTLRLVALYYSRGIFPTQGSNPKLLYLSLPVTSGKPPGNGYTGRVSGDTVEPRKGYQKQGGEGSRRQARLLASTERLKQVTGWWGRVEGMSASPDSHCLLTSALFMHVS